MDAIEPFKSIVNARRSVRAFLPKTVSRDTLDSVFEIAQRAPSNCNTQPWQVAVVRGDSIERLRKKIPEAFAAGQWTMDFPYDGKYDGVYKERQHGAAAELYSAMGIGRGDKEQRQVQFMKNFEFFDAPHAAFLFLPEPFGIREAADLGMYAQNLMLSLTAHGLASCPQTALSFVADLVRGELGISDNNKLLFGVSFGYEDRDNPANKCWTDRASVSEAVRFYS